MEEVDDPSNNIKIDAEGVDVVFGMVDGVYSISIKAAEEPQVVQTVQDAVVPASSQAVDDTVDKKACELFALGKVRGRYNEIHDRLIKEAEDECIVTAKEVIREPVDDEPGKNDRGRIY